MKTYINIEGPYRTYAIKDKKSDWMRFCCKHYICRDTSTLQPIYKLE